MLSTPPGLHFARHVGNVVSQATTRCMTRKVRFGSWIRQKSSSLVEPGVRILPLTPFVAQGCSSRRWFQHKATSPEGSPSLPQSTSATPLLSSKTSPSSPKKGNDFATKDDIPTRSEQRRSDWVITKRLLVHVWPKNNWKTRWTVLLGFGLLISSKVGVLKFSFR